MRFFHRHKWGPWSQPYAHAIYPDTYQRRQCFECGKIQQQIIGPLLERDKQAKEPIAEEDQQ